MVRDLDRRLRELERHDRELRWCRCPFDHARFKREVIPLLGVAGARTASQCADCGGAQPVIEVVAVESASWWWEAAP